MKESLQIVALFAGFLSCVTAFISLHNRSWKESTDYGNVIITSNIFENLWMSCAEDSTGIYDCWYFQSLLALPVVIEFNGRWKFLRFLRFGIMRLGDVMSLTPPPLMEEEFRRNITDHRAQNHLHLQAVLLGLDVTPSEEHLHPSDCEQQVYSLSLFIVN
ncbi:hypothetical protein MHYP_G00285300 [Metynnis hypsauchen]